MLAASTTSGRHLERQCAGMRGGLSCCPSLFCLVHSEFMTSRIIGDDYRTLLDSFTPGTELHTDCAMRLGRERLWRNGTVICLGRSVGWQ